MRPEMARLTLARKIATIVLMVVCGRSEQILFKPVGCEARKNSSRWSSVFS
jgi:hypothetical protein